MASRRSDPPGLAAFPVGAPAPLRGVTVLDLASVLAAPVAATILGEFGADVIKIERPVTGDFLRQHATVPGGRTAQWVQEGRNKRSVTIDLHHPTGRDLARQLAASVDVVVTSFRPSTAEHWGIHPDQLLEETAGLVILSVTGYGLTGPYRDRGAFDRITSAFAGHTHVSGYPDRPPVRCGFAVIDYMAAFLGAFAVVAALRARDEGLGGQVIDLALYEVAARASEAAVAESVLSGTPRDRVGNRHPRIVPASEATTADGCRISYHAGTESLFRRLAGAIGKPDLLNDPRFATQQSRVSHQDELYQEIDQWVSGLTVADAMDRLGAAGVPASPVHSLEEFLTDPHVVDRGTFEIVDDEELGPLPLVAPIPKLSVTPAHTRFTGTALGSATHEVLGDVLGLSPAAIAELIAEGVV